MKIRNFYKVLPLFTFISIFGTAMSHAFYLFPNQITRFQSSMLKSAQPFTAKGTVQLSQKKISTVLNWVAPQKYTLSLNQIDASFYDDDGGVSEWLIMRDHKNCQIKIDSQVFQCPLPSFWPMMELSANSEAVGKTLLFYKFLKDIDVPYQEVDVEKMLDTESADRRAKLALGFNGNSPIAVIEIQGPEYQISNDSTLGYPLLHYDQKFLFPTLARTMLEGEVISIKASAPLEVTRDKKKYTHILANKIEISINEELLATISRQNSTPLAKAPVMNFSKSALDINVLKAKLSNDGKSLLRTLLLSH